MLGGQHFVPDHLVEWAAVADHLYAADSGCDACLAHGLKPIVVGDMDSATGNLAGLRVVSLPDQDSTDCDKLIALVHQEVPNADLMLTGVEGDRLDHMLATLNSCAKGPLSPRILLRTGIGHVVKGCSDMLLTGRDGATVSVMPIGRAVASLSGVMWPFSDRELQLDDFVSISNQVSGDLFLEVKEGTVLLVVEGHVGPW